MLSTGHAVAAIAVMAAVTFLTRFLPFLLFDRGEAPPKIVLYLGRVLPPAIIAMLVVYCLKGCLLRVPRRVGPPADLGSGGGGAARVEAQ